jgi:hypothetical protein
MSIPSNFQSTNDPTAEAAEQRYRSMSWPAIMSLIAGVFSLLTIFGYVFLTIPLLAIALGWHALRTIRAARDEYTGTAFAWGGIAAAAVFGLVGFSIYDYWQAHNVPAGYQKITFDELQSNNTQEIIPPTAYDLEPTDLERDKRVYITGYIYPSRRTFKLKEFILVPTLSHCQFCQQKLSSTQMMYVKFTGDLRTDYTTNLVKLGGKFRVDRTQLLNPFGGLPYQLEADYFRE